MSKTVKFAEKAVAVSADLAWRAFEKLNSINQRPSFTPKWTDKPLLKSYQKVKPPLGWPRTTDSLCPKCIPEIREKVLNGEMPVDLLRNEKMGEIKAQIIERDGKIMMV
ncbi:MAG: radical SAM protein, partial [Bryobacterales bacterium]|nr:radical SAM protein [Bryobacterales bacterium]